MKIRNWLFITPILFGINNLQGQEKKKMSIKEAVEMALANSNITALNNAKVSSSEQELKISKNNQYPSFKLSTQYLRLSSVDLITHSSSSSSGSSTPSTPPSIDQLAIAQANLILPIFNGFSIRNSIKANDKKYEAEKFSAQHSKEQLAVQVISLFSNLYKAQQSALLIENNLKSAEQRVKDFTAMETNGIIARNDLLKAQLQQNKIQLTLEETKKNIAVINYQLINLLKLPDGTSVDVDVESIKADMNNQNSEDQGERNDIKSLIQKQAAAEIGIKIARGGYYPSIALTGGYIGLDIPNFLTINSAFNAGIGLSYDLASIFKNGNQVKLAKSHNEEIKQQVNILNDQIKEEVQRAQQEYDLALKQSAVYDEALIQATENYRIVKDKHDNSLVTTNDLLDADTEQLFVKINQTNARIDIAQKYYELQFAKGKLVNSLNISSN